MLALVLTAGIAIYLVVRIALAPGPDEWQARVKAGPVSIDVGVPTAIRLATSSNSTTSPLACDSVSCTRAIEPTRRTASCKAAEASGTRRILRA